MSEQTDNALKGAAYGATLGSFVPGVGTIAGGVVGAGLGYMAPTTPQKFVAPKFDAGNPYGTALGAYNPSDPRAAQAYTGSYDPTKGANQLNSTDATLGIDRFNYGDYVGKLDAGLKAQTDENTATEQNRAYNSGAARGLGNSGASRALTAKARLMGDRTYAMGSAQNATNATQIKMREDDARRSAALGISDKNLQNDQFSATYGEGQRQFDNRLGEDQAQFQTTATHNSDALNENQRQFNQEALYGTALDKYQQNVVNPAQKKEAYNAGLVSAGTNIAGAGISAAPALLLCAAAEATFGIDHEVTNKMRFMMNVQLAGSRVQDIYRRNMKRWAMEIGRSSAAKKMASDVFRTISTFAVGSMNANGEVTV